MVCATENDRGSFELSAVKLRAVRDREIHGMARLLAISGATCLACPD